MTDFFIYRSCNLSDLNVRAILQRNTDVLNRGNALIDGSNSGQPTDETDGSDNPTLDIGNAAWGEPTQGNGTLPPGTYDYDIVPVDTCTGRTGQPIQLPQLTITTLGQIAQLHVQFNTKPKPCEAANIRRDGVIIGPIFPFEDNIPDNLTVVTQPDPLGSYINGTAETFTRVSGADLIAGDALQYNDFAVKVKQIIGSDIFIDPPIPATLIEPEGFYNAENRSGFYEAFSTMSDTLPVKPPFFPGLSTVFIPEFPVGSQVKWPGPFMSFKLLPPVSIFPFLNDIQAGDLIAYGSKTGIVVHVERVPPPINPGTGPGPSFGTVLVLPFGILPIPPLPAGQFWIVYRPEIAPTLGAYFSAYEADSHNLDITSNPAGEDNKASTLTLTVPVPGFSDFNDVGALLFKAAAAPVAALAGTDLSSPEPDFIQPSSVTHVINNPRGRLNTFRVMGDGVAPIPANGPPAVLTAGQQIIIDSTLVTISEVTEVLPPGGTPGDPRPFHPGEYEVEFTPELSPDPATPFPFTALARPLSPAGGWSTIPNFKSPYLIPPTIAPTGNYTRLTRLVSITNETDAWQWEEDGEYTDRSGTVDGSLAAAQFDQLLAQNAYPGGLTGLLGTLRGPNGNSQTNVFVSSNGEITILGGALTGVNAVADLGSGEVIDLNYNREFAASACGDLAITDALNNTLDTGGVAVLRLESREVISDLAPCPAGQTAEVETQLFCLGVATPNDPVQPTDHIRVYWSSTGRFITGVDRTLLKLGLTRPEADAAILLNSVGRVLTTTEISDVEVASTKALLALGTTQEIMNVLADTRMHRLNDGPITKEQMRFMLSGRGESGVAQRAPGTDTLGMITEAGYRPIDDFILKAHNLAALSFKYNGSFNVCPLDPALDAAEDAVSIFADGVGSSISELADAALASVPEGPLRDHVAAFLAIMEGTMNGLVRSGEELLAWLTDTGFASSQEVISGILGGADGDPSLACLAGPQGASASFNASATVSSFALIDESLGGIADGFKQRFNLSSMFATSVFSVLCGVQSAFQEAVGQFGGDQVENFTKVALGCLPSATDLAESGVDWPSVEVQVAFECSLERLDIFIDIVNAMLAEANEVIDLGNSLEAGFVTRVVDARNRSCSADQDLGSLVGGLKSLSNVQT